MRSFFHRRPSGSRLFFLSALVAALLLVPVAAASAAEVKVTIAGNGSGKVVDYGGTSTIDCESPPPGTGVCTSATTEPGGAWKEEAAPGSEFAGWTVKKGIKIECGAVEVCVLSGATIELEATFKLKPDVHITIEGSGSGEVVDKGPNAAEHGTPPIICLYTSPGPATGTCDAVHGVISGFPGITVEAHAAPDSEFVEWVVEKGLGEGSCEPVTAPTCGVFALNEEFEPEEVKITAIFAALPKFKLTVTKSGSGSGTVKGGSPAEPNTINCGSGAGCEHEYTEGALVTLTHEAPGDSEFKEWSGACSGSGACEVTMSEVKSVNAKFDLIPKFKLTVTKSGTGSGTVTSAPAGISCGAACSAEFESGKEVELSKSADSGSEFKEWTGACSGSGSCKVTMSAAKAVGAVFNAKSSSDGGSGGGSTGGGGAPPPPAEEKCVVPKLAKKTLAQARSALAAAHCELGKVTKPKKPKGPLVVKSSKPGAGTSLVAGGKVNLKLGPKPKKKKK